MTVADEDCPGCWCDPMAPHNGKGSCGTSGELDWSSPAGIPTTEFIRGPKDRGDGKPDPRYIQSNLYTLAAVGGVYGLLALEVEQRHLDVLEPWRLDSKAPRAIDYIHHNRQDRRSER